MFAELTLAGWLFLIVAWGGVIGLSAFCFVKVMTGEKDLSAEENN